MSHPVDAPNPLEICLFLSLVAIGTTATMAAPVDVGQLDKLVANDARDEDQFGNSVDIFGDLAVVGAWRRDSKETETGGAYIYQRDGDSWEQLARLTGSDTRFRSFFGGSVGIFEQRVIVGARNGNPFDPVEPAPGTAYIFEQGSKSTIWDEVAQLRGKDTLPADFFGDAVDLGDDLAVVGALRNDEVFVDSGAVYVFEKQDEDWIQVAKLSPSDSTANKFFGLSVAIDGDRIVVGSNDSEAAINAGAAYVFERSPDATWTQIAKLTADDAAAGDAFGTDVSISGGNIIVGASLHNRDGVDQGAAYVFRESEDGWNQTDKLVASDAEDMDQFGWSVAIAGHSAVVTSIEDDGGTGSSYVFDLSEDIAREVAKIRPKDAGFRDNFGTSVSIFGSEAIIGRWRDDSEARNAGSAYIFAVPEPSALLQACVALLLLSAVGARRWRLLLRHS